MIYLAIKGRFEEGTWADGLVKNTMLKWMVEVVLSRVGILISMSSLAKESKTELQSDIADKKSILCSEFLSIFESWSEILWDFKVLWEIQYFRRLIGRKSHLKALHSTGSLLCFKPILYPKNEIPYIHMQIFAL